MDNWKAWAALFLSVCVMVVVLAYMDYYAEAVIVAVAVPFGLGIVCALLGYLKRGREIRHRERLAMIEKGIYIEARKHEAGIPSLAVVLLVGIGLATVIASDVEFFGFALLFVGIGLIVRSRMLRNRKIEQEAGPDSPDGQESPDGPPAEPEDSPAAESPDAPESQDGQDKPDAAESPDTAESPDAAESPESPDSQDGPESPDGPPAEPEDSPAAEKRTTKDKDEA